MKKWYYLLLTGIVASLPLFGQSDPSGAVPLIRASQDTVSHNLPRFTWQSQDIMIYNDGDAPLEITITDSPGDIPTTRPGKTNIPFSTRTLIQRLEEKLAASNINPAEVQRLAQPFSATSQEAIAITDSIGDVQNAGLDLVSLDIDEDFLSYQYTVEFAGTPDSSAIALVSLDLDQNAGTGSFPVPLGLGPGIFDVGSEYDLIMDIGNLVGDSLGIPPSAFVIVGGDTSLNLVGLPMPLSFDGNQVQANLLKLFFPQLVFDNMNVAMAAVGISALDFPDLAPEYGHGLRGSENGVSWMVQFDDSGLSTNPITAAIAPGDSFLFSNQVITVNPDGNYSANINIANNSGNAPDFQIPVQLTVGGILTPQISVTPAAISDTLQNTQGIQSYNLTVENPGVGALIYAVADSSAPGDDWLIIAGIPVGNIPGGGSVRFSFDVDPSGLTAGTTYQAQLIFTSNAVNGMQYNVPVTIYIESATGISEPAAIPETLVLHENYPNPFNPSTQIRFEVPQQQRIMLAIYNVIGQRIATLADRQFAPGSYEVDWHGVNENGIAVGSGIYFYQLSAGSSVITKKMILVR